MESSLAVATLRGERLLSPLCFLRVDVEIMGHNLPTYLRVLPMSDFDVIFGMDWLREYHASLECFEGRVMFSPKGRP